MRDAAKQSPRQSINIELRGTWQKMKRTFLPFPGFCDTTITARGEGSNGLDRGGNGDWGRGHTSLRI